jgi:hypothetical protein
MHTVLTPNLAGDSDKLKPQRLITIWDLTHVLRIFAFFQENLPTITQKLLTSAICSTVTAQTA